MHTRASTMQAAPTPRQAQKSIFVRPCGSEPLPNAPRLNGQAHQGATAMRTNLPQSGSTFVRWLDQSTATDHHLAVMTIVAAAQTTTANLIGSSSAYPVASSSSISPAWGRRSSPLRTISSSLASMSTKQDDTDSPESGAVAAAV